MPAPFFPPTTAAMAVPAPADPPMISASFVSDEPLLNTEVISHFDGSPVWVVVGTGLFREFFKRVRPQPVFASSAAVVSRYR
jgi:hypothetical protein